MPKFDPNFDELERFKYRKTTSKKAKGNTISEIRNKTDQTKRHFNFETLYHPFSGVFKEKFKTNGPEGLLNLEMQNRMTEFFESSYQPTNLVNRPFPIENVDFSFRGSFSSYNWEIFFHIPFLIACRLNENQRFEEADKWFKFIFNPLNNSNQSGDKFPNIFWNTKPLNELGRPQNIDQLLQILSKDYDTLDDEGDENKDDIIIQVNEWMRNPFNPHAIAQMRLGAYQKAVVMKYINNLVSWGDQLFRRDTIESINEATMLYLQAAEVLGRRPQMIDIVEKEEESLTYSKISENLDEYLDSLEERFDVMVNGTFFKKFTLLDNKETDIEVPGSLSANVFCIPNNDKMMGYWDLVEDRLFKIRHCMNIEGIERKLPLFEPPIDPGLLVRAFAAGIDIGTILNDVNAPLPSYRFNVFLQKALEICNELKSLGSNLLSALEKKDAEELSLLRSKHEISLLKSIISIKKLNIDEANENLSSINKSKELIEYKKTYYSTRQFMNNYETVHLISELYSMQLEKLAANLSSISQAMYKLPNKTFDIAGSLSGTVVETTKPAKVAESGATALNLLSWIAKSCSFISGTMGGYQRRWDDWKFQERSAEKELEQVERQILSSEIRLRIAEKDLENQEKQIENAEEAETFLKDKFTNKELYNWMVGQISKIYFQSYQMAYDYAKQAQKAYQYEMMRPDVSFIEFGYWDGLKKGLLAGEKLYFDLRRMEKAYLENSRRDYELTKNISLIMINPMAIVSLRNTGECFFGIPEEVFDLDHPGHYMRRIKSISITVPCVVGPYTNVNCTLTQMNSRIRTKPMAHDEYRYTDIEDSRFIHYYGSIQSIATSSSQNDSGLFEVNFRDEKYLPFEGTGAISEWRLELPKEFRQFDYDTISDVIIHMKYTAKQGGGSLKEKAIENIRKSISDYAENGGLLHRLFSMRSDFPNEWYRLSNPSEGTSNEVFLDLRDRLPFICNGKTVQIEGMNLIVRTKDGAVLDRDLELKLTNCKEDETRMVEVPSAVDPTVGLPCRIGAWDSSTDSLQWKISLPNIESLKNIHDILLICDYTLQ